MRAHARTTALILAAATAAGGCAKKKAEPPWPSPTVQSVAGNVQYLESDEKDWARLKPGLKVAAGGGIRSGSSGLAVLAFRDGTRLRLSGGTEFRLEKNGPEAAEVRVSVGLMEAWVKKLTGRDFLARTPSAVAAVRGTRFRTEVDASGRTVLDLFEGRLAVRDASGNERELRKGERLVADAARGIADSAPMPIPPRVRMPVSAPGEKLLMKAKAVLPAKRRRRRVRAPRKRPKVSQQRPKLDKLDLEAPVPLDDREAEADEDLQAPKGGLRAP